MSRLQTRVSASNKGLPFIDVFLFYFLLALAILIICQSTLCLIIYVNSLVFIISFFMQRCKHFEIGGDKKGKGTSLF